MRLAVVLLVLWSVSATSAADAPNLLGEWKLTSATGGDFAAKLRENVSRLTFDAETVTAGRSAKYVQNAEKKTLDLTIAGGPKAEQGKYLGVYELTGNTLKWHLAQPGKDRPSGFDAKPDTAVVLTLTRSSGK